MTTRRIHGAGGSLAARPTAKRQPAPATPPRLGVAWACANSRKRPNRTWSASPRPTAKRTIGDTEGTSAIVSVVWVDFRTTHDMTAFKSVMDRQGSGDIRPLAAPLLGLADIRFTGLNYDSEPIGRSIAITETEQATGTVAPDLLDALAEVASQFSKP